jgi:hypothetical protein
VSVSDAAVLPTTVRGGAFSVRWLAPELIHPEKFGLRECSPSKESDTYALAMLMYEVRVDHHAFSSVV